MSALEYLQISRREVFSDASSFVLYVYKHKLLNIHGKTLKTKLTKAGVTWKYKHGLIH